MQQVIICNRFAFPDNSATSQLLSDLAIHLAREQVTVTVITGRYFYVHSSEEMASETICQGVSIKRVWSTNFGRARFLGRSIDLFSFGLGLALTLHRLAGKGDIVIAKTDPPLLSVLCAIVVRRRKARLVNWLQDLYPELAVALGMLSQSNVIVRILGALRDWSLKSASANVVISKSMASRIEASGVARQTIVQIQNWADDRKLYPIEPQINTLRKLWELEESFVVGYSGNLGRAHEHQTILDAAALLKSAPQIKFLMVGGGTGQDSLKTEVLRRGLTRSFVFKPYQSECDLGLSLSSADVHWISLKPECEGLVFPSKIYGIAAVGRPIIIIGSPTGDLARTVQLYNCGHIVAPGDAIGLSQYLLDLHNKVELRRLLGINSRSMIDSAYSRDLALRRWSSLIKELSESNPM